MKKVSNKARGDLIVIALVTLLVFISARYFNLFVFLEDLFRNSSKALTYIDEIFTVLLALSIGFAVFSWRRWRELKRETIARMKAQEELLKLADTKVETEMIISRQLHSEIDLRKRHI